MVQTALLRGANPTDRIFDCTHKRMRACPRRLVEQNRTGQRKRSRCRKSISQKSLAKLEWRDDRDSQPNPMLRPRPVKHELDLSCSTGAIATIDFRRRCLDCLLGTVRGPHRKERRLNPPVEPLSLC